MDIWIHTRNNIIFFRINVFILWNVFHLENVCPWIVFLTNTTWHCKRFKTLKWKPCWSGPVVPVKFTSDNLPKVTQSKLIQRPKSVQIILDINVLKFSRLLFVIYHIMLPYRYLSAGRYADKVIQSQNYIITFLSLV